MCVCASVCVCVCVCVCGRARVCVCSLRFMLLYCSVGAERCQPFLQEEFDAQRYSNTIIESQQVAQALEHIAASVSLLDRDLNHQVSQHIPSVIQI